MFYHWMFKLARWITLWSPAQGQIRPAGDADPPGGVMDVAPMHRNDRRRDSLQSLGHAQLGPAPVQGAQRATPRAIRRRSNRQRER